MIKSLNYEGHEIQYDDKFVDSWTTQKMLMDPARQFEAMDMIFVGRSDEVASKLGDSMTEMQHLLQRVVTIEGNAGKN